MEVLVSITCTTYNQEKYISKAIESFLMQKTKFAFEILIGEDVSTDNTGKIVNEYANKYPNLVKVITYKKNIGGVENMLQLFERAKGKYVALCEGDDYWTDADKLQKQVDFMTRFPECSLCYHAARIFNMQKNSNEGFIRPYKKNCIQPADIFFYGGGDDVPTASILFKREFLIDPPQFFHESPVGDHPIALILSYHGRIGYIDEVMSVRNSWVPNSWSTIFLSSSGNELRIKHIRAMITLLNSFDIYSKRRYSQKVRKRVLSGEMEILKIQCKDPYKDKQFLELYKPLSKTDKVKIWASYKMPVLCNKYIKLKKGIEQKFTK